MLVKVQFWQTALRQCSSSVKTYPVQKKHPVQNAQWWNRIPLFKVPQNHTVSRAHALLIPPIGTCPFFPPHSLIDSFFYLSVLLRQGTSSFFFLWSYFKLKLSNLIKVNFTRGNIVKSRTGTFSYRCIRRHRNIIALSWSKSCYNCPCHVRTASDYTACIKWYWMIGAFPKVNSIALKSSIVKPLRERIPSNLELRCCYFREHYIVRCTTRN